MVADFCIWWKNANVSTSHVASIKNQFTSHTPSFPSLLAPPLDSLELHRFCGSAPLVRFVFEIQG
jgi:hypothetical protein